jgi:hypothetical protein
MVMFDRAELDSVITRGGVGVGRLMDGRKVCLCTRPHFLDKGDPEEEAGALASV